MLTLIRRSKFISVWVTQLHASNSVNARPKSYLILPLVQIADPDMRGIE